MAASGYFYRLERNASRQLWGRVLSGGIAFLMPIDANPKKNQSKKLTPGH
jgi:hypothetical protein